MNGDDEVDGGCWAEGEMNGRVYRWSEKQKTPLHLEKVGRRFLSFSNERPHFDVDA